MGLGGRSRGGVRPWSCRDETTPLRVLSYFKRGGDARGVVYAGQLANPSISDQSLENFSVILESAFLPWLQLSSQLPRLGLARP